MRKVRVGPAQAVVIAVSIVLSISFIYIAMSQFILPMVGIGEYAATDIVSVGQVKTVMNMTPMACNKFVDMSLSLGVMRNGAGSVSTEDVWMNLNTIEQIEIARRSQENGNLVRVTYDYFRFAPCRNSRNVKKIEILEK